MIVKIISKMIINDNEYLQSIAFPLFNASGDVAAGFSEDFSLMLHQFLLLGFSCSKNGHIQKFFSGLKIKVEI